MSIVLAVEYCIVLLLLCFLISEYFVSGGVHTCL